MTKTPFLNVYYPTPADLAKAAQGVPLGRWAEPSEMGLALVYLASDESAFMTGSEFVIDGGSTAV